LGEDKRRLDPVRIRKRRLDCRLDDEIRRTEIRLPDAEIDDVAALRGDLHGARQHREGILLANTVEGGDSLQHGSPPDDFARQFNPIAGQMQTPGRHRRREAQKGSPGLDPGLLTQLKPRVLQA